MLQKRRNTREGGGRCTRLEAAKLGASICRQAREAGPCPRQPLEHAGKPWAAAPAQAHNDAEHGSWAIHPEAGHIQRRVDQASRVVAQVEDEGLGSVTLQARGLDR